jgi:hypothetical protein
MAEIAKMMLLFVAQAKLTGQAKPKSFNKLTNALDKF